MEKIIEYFLEMELLTDMHERIGVMDFFMLDKHIDGIYGFDSVELKSETEFKEIVKVYKNWINWLPDYISDIFNLTAIINKSHTLLSDRKYLEEFDNYKIAEFLKIILNNSHFDISLIHNPIHSPMSEQYSNNVSRGIYLWTSLDQLARWFCKHKKEKIYFNHIFNDDSFLSDSNKQELKNIFDSKLFQDIKKWRNFFVHHEADYEMEFYDGVFNDVATGWFLKLVSMMVAIIYDVVSEEIGIDKAIEE